MNLMQIASQLSGASAFLIRNGIFKEHYPSDWEENFNASSHQLAMEDAAKAAAFLFEIGQQNMITGIMEGLEAATWLMSPEQDPEQHYLLLKGIFEQIMILAESIETPNLLLDSEEEEEEGDPQDGMELENLDQKFHLEACFAL